MPLKPGCGATSENIRELIAAGYPRRQAVAVALSHERKTCRRRRGHASGNTSRDSRNARALAKLSDRELEKLDTEVLDRAAFGVAEGDTIEIPIDEVGIVYPEDLVGAEYDVQHRPWKWKPYINEPVEFKYRQGRVVLSDGHHRYTLRKMLGRKTITGVMLRIHDNPIKAIRATR